MTKTSAYYIGRAREMYENAAAHASIAGDSRLSLEARRRADQLCRRYVLAAGGFENLAFAAAAREGNLVELKL